MFDPLDDDREEALASAALGIMPETAPTPPAAVSLGFLRSKDGSPNMLVLPVLSRP